MSGWPASLILSVNGRRLYHIVLPRIGICIRDLNERWGIFLRRGSLAAHFEEPFHPYPFAHCHLSSLKEILFEASLFTYLHPRKTLIERHSLNQRTPLLTFALRSRSSLSLSPILEHIARQASARYLFKVGDCLLRCR